MNQRLLDFFETSWWQGVPILIRNKQKVFKSLCILILSGLGIWAARGNFQNYSNYEVITNIDVIREETSQFPAISFCMLLNDTKLALNTSNIIVSCSFGMQNSSLKDFQYYNIRIGNLDNYACYRFNSGKNIYNEPAKIRSLMKAGLNFGLFV